MTDDALDVARRAVEALSKVLPEEVDALGLSSVSKLPMKAHVFREGLIWRFEELARTALSAFERSDYVGAIVVIRAAMETFAALVYLHRLLKRTIAEGVTDRTDADLESLLLGWRSWDEMPRAKQVMTLIEHVDKELSDQTGEKSKRFLVVYEGLSEYAHPNYAGLHGAYAVVDKEELIVSFRRGGRDPARHRRMGLDAFTFTLERFFYYYNESGDLLHAFADVCEAALDTERVSKRLKKQSRAQDGRG